MPFRGPRGIASAASAFRGVVARRRSDAALGRPASDGNAARCVLWAREARKNLRDNGLDPSKLPLVIQYNKRDLPNIRSEDEIMRMAAMGKEPTFLATATHGTGVAETFLGLVQSTWEHLEREHQLAQRFGLDQREVMKNLSTRFGVKMDAGGA